MGDPFFIKVNDKPGVRPTIVEFVTDNIIMRVSSVGGSLHISSSVDLSVEPVDPNHITVGCKIYPCSAG